MLRHDPGCLMPARGLPIRRRPQIDPWKAMTEEEVLAEFRAAGALLEGHFILSSGLHSPRYLQSARVLMDPMRASRLATAVAAGLPREIRSQIEIVVSPAMGGVIA